MTAIAEETRILRGGTMSRFMRPAARLAVLLATGALGACTSTSGDKGKDASFLDFLPAGGAGLQPGADADGELGGAGATTIALGYQQATLARDGDKVVLDLKDRRPLPFPEIVATFESFQQADSVVDGLITSRTDTVTRGGVKESNLAGRLLDGGKIDDLSFMSFAYWAVYDTHDDNNLVTAAGGPLGDNAPDLAAGAGLKTATYNGTTLGARANDDGSDFHLLAGDIELKADFVANSMRAEITDLDLIDPVSGRHDGGGPDFVFDHAAIGTILGVPGFQGKTDDGTFTATMDGATVGPGTGSFAELSGGFYGKNLEEAGGGWYVATPAGADPAKQPAMEWSGSFGARR